MNHRRPHSTSAPPPSTSALIAASTVYHPPASSPPAAAAAGAALRHASAPPVPMDQRTGSIPTKRMLKRRDSYSSTISDIGGGATVQRTGSTGSLTDRRFRKDRGRRGSGDVGRQSVETVRRGSADMGTERPSAPTPRAAAGATGTGTGRKRGIWNQEAGGDEDSSGDYAADDDSGSYGFSSTRPVRTSSLQSNNSTRTFPTTTRIKPKEHQNTSASIFRDSSSSSSSSSGDGHKRRNSDSGLPGRNTHKPPLSSGGVARLSSGDYADSASSPELESIAEDSLANGGRLRKAPTKILEEDSEDSSCSDDTFDFHKGGRGIDRTGRSPSHLLPPCTSPRVMHKYSPPPRSVSPAKSALKPSPGRTHNDAASARKTRVSFSDEDSVTRLPVLPRTMVHAVLAPSPPPSDSSQESIVGLESALRYPRGQPPLGAAVAVKRLLGVDGDGGGRLRKGPLTPPGVPELRLMPGTPEEKSEVEGGLGGGLEGLPGGFTGTRVGAGIRNTGQEGAKDDDSGDSGDSGDSIYSDAYEDLTALPGILEVVPVSATQHSSPPHTPPLPPQPSPLPPSFLIPKTKRRHSNPQYQYPSSSSSTASSSSTSSSIVSVSSFRRKPRAKRTGLRASMRTPLPSTHRSGEKSKSRFSVDSERGVMRRFGGSGKMVGGAGLGSLGTGAGERRGFWGVFMGKGKGRMFTKGKQGKGKGKEAAALPAPTPTIRIMKPRPPRNSTCTNGATSVGSGAEKESLGEEAEGKQVIGYLEKRKRFWRVRRLLGLET